MSSRQWGELERAFDSWVQARFGTEEGSGRHCTKWACFRWHELGHERIIEGRAGAMAFNAGSTSSTPSLHAMASYGAGTDSDPGHVMIVEEISTDGSTIRVSEMIVGDRDWHVDAPHEYDDTKTFTRCSDGRFTSWNGRPITFAAFPQ